MAMASSGLMEVRVEVSILSASPLGLYRRSGVGTKLCIRSVMCLASFSWRFSRSFGHSVVTVVTPFHFNTRYK